MITKEMIKTKIDNVPEERLEKLYDVISEYEEPMKKSRTEEILQQARESRSRISGFLTDEDLELYKNYGRK